MENNYSKEKFTDEAGTDTCYHTPQENGGASSVWDFIKEIAKFTVLSLLIVAPFRIFIAQPFLVSGGSMDPTFADGEYLIIDEISYNFKNPERGQVVVFRYPNDPSKYFIKRIIGLPGETVIYKNGEVTIKDKNNKKELTIAALFALLEVKESGNLASNFGVRSTLGVYGTILLTDYKNTVY